MQQRALTLTSPDHRRSRAAALTAWIQEEAVRFSPGLVLLQELSAIQRRLECVSQTIMIQLQAEAPCFPSWRLFLARLALYSHSAPVNVMFFSNKTHFLLLHFARPLRR